MEATGRVNPMPPPSADERERLEAEAAAVKARVARRAAVLPARRRRPAAAGMSPDRWSTRRGDVVLDLGGLDRREAEDDHPLALDHHACQALIVRG